MSKIAPLEPVSFRGFLFQWVRQMAGRFPERGGAATPHAAVVRARLRAIAEFALPAKTTVGSLSGLSAAVLVATSMACLAGPCSSEIAAVQARLDARLAAKAATGPSAPESAEALRHRQPTPRSIAEALIALGKISPEKAKIIGGAMTRARDADQAGDKAACEDALREVEQALGP